MAHPRSELGIVDFFIDGARFQKHLVRAFGHNPALVEHNDLVRVQHCADALGDHDHRRAKSGLCDRVLDLRLRLDIDGTRGIIENENRRFADESACNGDALFLAAREICAAFFDMGIIAFGHAHDKIVRLGSFCGCDYFIFCGIRSSIANVVPDSSCEQHSILGHYRNMLKQRIRSQAPDIQLINTNPPRRSVVKTRNQIDEARFARAGCTKDCGRLSWLRARTDFFQNSKICGPVVVERNAFEFDLATAWLWK